MPDVFTVFLNRDDDDDDPFLSRGEGYSPIKLTGVLVGKFREHP